MLEFGSDDSTVLWRYLWWSVIGGLMFNFFSS